MITASAVTAIGQRLAEVGLNRCRAVAAAPLPPQVWLPASTDQATNPVARPGADGPVPSSLLVVGHGGTAMWDHLTAGLAAGSELDAAEDPIDTFSVEVTEAAIEAQWPDIPRRLLYPHSDCPVDLVALGQAIGWLSSSPLGLGIHPGWGLWSAFRAVWHLSAELERPACSDVGPPADVCRSCRTHDCLEACPAGAVNPGLPFDLNACFTHRSEPASGCAATCLARLACPVGPEHRYRREQMAYHYGISRPPVRVEEPS